MNLCLDIGNTRTKAGVFEGNRLVEYAVWTNGTTGDIASFQRRFAFSRVMISAVTPQSPLFRPALESMGLEVVFLETNTPLPFINAYSTPDTLGKDRLAAIAGAHALYSGKNVLVIDAGTCIKYDLLDAEGVYQGGNISPGLLMRIRAMHEQTAQLPMVDMDLPASFVGNSTQTALQNGALWGAILEVNGFISLFAEKWNDLIVLITGGNAVFLHPQIQWQPCQHEPELILYGLNHILRHNS